MLIDINAIIRRGYEKMHYHGRTTFSLRSLNPSCVLLRFFNIPAEPSAKVRFRQRYRGNGDFILLLIFVIQEILVQLLVEIGHFDISHVYSSHCHVSYCKSYNGIPSLSTANNFFEKSPSVSWTIEGMILSRSQVQAVVSDSGRASHQP